MAEILSQSQIDELLNNLSSGDVNLQELEANDKKIKEYDFRSPKKITKETIKLLKGIYENYCRMVTSRLTSMLRLMCDVTVEQVEESIFHEYNNALDDYVLMGLVDVKYPDNTVSDSQILMEVSKPLSFVIIDRLLGGTGEEYEHDRDYTDIELFLLGNMLKQLVKHMGSNWESTLEIDTELTKIETNSRFIQSINYNDTVVIVVLNVSLNQSTGKITVCIPSSILDEILKKASNYSKSSKRSDQSREEQKAAIMSSIKSSNLTITGVLGKAQATLDDVLHMQVGDLILLDKDINKDIDIHVDGKKWFEGKWGTRKNKGVIKINKITH
ncbi:flagellar motor switch protein FliM [Sedimentibacter hydroxybenzoicus DSM 7310]|uniref:Flagellar motor switch protein FliM n=1 Tax=Sedimentibacter hydroxybenzoicus DSM 7310 TaxID=1123245 RepID=A0A974BGU9_SEDHY|nr:flagellar motor switch protein FliM [Sedimentibacter hydroxybenzoicus]NYB72602.1 flagellar motor switch protein FliM [Sedimentibacter hydroxybenzoicus DSM 7310]